MSYIDTYPIQHSTIMRLYSESDEIMVDPDYQRMGGVWTKEKKQLLIDSILNNYDIPKIYFHVFSREEKNKLGFSYAIIDGRQRLEAIWKFIEGEFTLSDDFIYQDDPSIKLSNLSYEDLAQHHPKIKIKFDSFVLPVIGVQTDELELIEDMFSRLNEAVPLNAAEKRNAIGGKMVQAIREVSIHAFFTNKVKFNNNRYKHREVAARFLLIESSLHTVSKLIDTKKEYLDALARNYKENRDNEVDELQKQTIEILDNLNNIFTQQDELLRAQGNMVIYYLIMKLAMKENETAKITRRKLLDFQQKVKDNRIIAETNYEDAKYELLEYDRLTQQGTNDASNIKERVRVLAEELGLARTYI